MGTVRAARNPRPGGALVAGTVAVDREAGVMAKPLSASTGDRDSVSRSLEHRNEFTWLSRA
jgi:hypothetical protein